MFVRQKIEQGLWSFPDPLGLHRQQHVEHQPLKAGLQFLAIEVLHHLILVRVATLHHRLVEGLREIAQQSPR